MKYDEIRFCESCGRVMDERSIHDGFYPDTGSRKYISVKVCSLFEKERGHFRYRRWGRNDALLHLFNKSP